MNLAHRSVAINPGSTRMVEPPSIRGGWIRRTAGHADLFERVRLLRRYSAKKPGVVRRLNSARSSFKSVLEIQRQLSVNVARIFRAHVRQRLLDVVASEVVRHSHLNLR